MLRVIQRAAGRIKRRTVSLDWINRRATNEALQSSDLENRGEFSERAEPINEEFDGDGAVFSLPMSGVNGVGVRVESLVEDTAESSGEGGDHMDAVNSIMDEGFNQRKWQPETAENVSKFPFSCVLTPDEIAENLLDSHGLNVCIVDVSAEARMTDYFVIASGRSKRHVQALASSTLYMLKQRCKAKAIREVSQGVYPHIEGEVAGGWLMVDAGSVMVHVFSPSAREYYDLEGLWGNETNMRHLASRTTIETLETIQNEEDEIGDEDSSEDNTEHALSEQEGGAHNVDEIGENVEGDSNIDDVVSNGVSSGNDEDDVDEYGVRHAVMQDLNEVDDDDDDDQQRERDAREFDSN